MHLEMLSAKIAAILSVLIALMISRLIFKWKGWNIFVPIDILRPEQNVQTFEDGETSKYIF